MALLEQRVHGLRWGLEAGGPILMVSLTGWGCSPCMCIGRAWAQPTCCPAHAPLFTMICWVCAASPRAAAMGLGTADLLYLHNPAESQLGSVGRQEFMKASRWQQCSPVRACALRPARLGVCLVRGAVLHAVERSR